MTADHREDVDKAVAWFSARGLVASARGPNALFVGKPAGYLEDGTRVLEPTLFLEAENDAWCLRRHRFGGGIDDGPCVAFEAALELGARLLALPTSDFAAHFQPGQLESDRKPKD